MKIGEKEARSKSRVIISKVVLFSLSLLGTLLPIVAQGSEGSVAKSGEQLYEEACSNCHGLDGRGVSAQQLGFDTPVPDFTVCNFATREPNADWIAVAHEGGPARGFSRLMPAFGGVLNEKELARVMEHVRSFCPDASWPRGELNLPRAMITEKAYPEDEAVYTVGIPLEGESAFSNEIVYEQRFGARHQFELVIPFGWRELMSAHPDIGDCVGGVGDVAVGAKSAVYHSIDKGSIFSVAGEVILPSGEADKGLGKGTTVFEPFASFGQILPSDFFLHAQAGLELPADTDKAEQEGFWRFALGRTFAEGKWGRAWSPMLEVLAARELEEGADVSWDVLPQLQFTVNTRQHIMMNVGVRLPVTDSANRDTELLVYILWDWFDGGLLEGW